MAAARSGPLGPAQMVPWLGQYWAPHLLSARVTGTFGDRSLDGTPVYAEKNWGAAFADHWWWGQGRGVAFAGGRIHGVAPTAVVAWTPDGLVALAPPFARTVARAGGGEWHIRATSPRWRVEIEGEACGALRLPVPLPGSAGSRSARDHHLLGQIEARVWRGRRLWLAHVGLAGLEDGATPAWFMTSSAMSSSPPSARPSSRSTWSQTALRRQPHARAARRRSCSRPTSIGARAVLDQPVGVEHDASRPPGRRPRGARTSVDARAQRRAGLGADERRQPVERRDQRRQVARPARTSAGASPGRRSPASTVAIGRSSSAVARSGDVRQHAVGRVAVVGVGGQHRAQLPHPRGGLRRRGP